MSSWQFSRPKIDLVEYFILRPLLEAGLFHFQTCKGQNGNLNDALRTTANAEWRGMATSWSLTHAHRCIFMFIPISSSKEEEKDRITPQSIFFHGLIYFIWKVLIHLLSLQCFEVCRQFLSVTGLLNCFPRYIKDFQVYDQHKVGKITVELQGRINDCQALTYRQYHKAKDIEKYTSNKLLTIRSVLIPCTFVVLKLFVIDPWRLCFPFVCKIGLHQTWCLNHLVL